MRRRGQGGYGIKADMSDFVESTDPEYLKYKNKIMTMQKSINRYIESQKAIKRRKNKKSFFGRLFK